MASGDREIGKMPGFDGYELWHNENGSITFQCTPTRPGTYKIAVEHEGVPLEGLPVCCVVKVAGEGYITAYKDEGDLDIDFSQSNEENALPAIGHVEEEPEQITPEAFPEEDQEEEEEIPKPDVQDLDQPRESTVEIPGATSSPGAIEESYYTNQSTKHPEVKLSLEHALNNKKVRDLLSGLNLHFLQKSILRYKDQDHELKLALQQLQGDIKDGLQRKGYHGDIKELGSTKDGSKVKSLDEVDMAFVLERSCIFTVNQRPDKTHEYDVDRTDKDSQVKVEPRVVREDFAKDIIEIVNGVQLPPGLAHSGYKAPDFSGVRYNGPATTLLMTWSPKQGEKRELSMDITLMLQLPQSDERDLQQHIKDRCRPLHTAMADEIFWFNGIHLFPNPISNRWELTTASYEANLLANIPKETPFITCIRMCKMIAAMLAALPTGTTERAESQRNPPTDEMATINTVLSHPNHQTQEYMKYGHAFLTPETGEQFREMTKKANSINTAAIKHIALHLASKKPETFQTNKNKSDEYFNKLVANLVSEVFEYISSNDSDVEHFFLGSRIRPMSLATWAAQSCNCGVLTAMTRNQCQLVAHTLQHGWYHEEYSETSLQEYLVPFDKLEYAEDTYKVPVEFDGTHCNDNFLIILKLINTLGNNIGGLILVHSGKCEKTSVDMLTSSFEAFCKSHKVWKTLKIISSIRPNEFYLHVNRFRELMTITSHPYLEETSGTDGLIDSIKPVNTEHTSVTQIPVARESYHISNKKIIRKIHTSKVIDKEDVSATSTSSYTTEISQPAQHVESSQQISTARLVSTPAAKRTLPKTDEADQLLQKRGNLSWTRDGAGWETNLQTINIDLEANIKTLIQSERTILRLSQPINFIPAKNSILRKWSHHGHIGLEEALTHLEKICDQRKSLAVGMNSWPAHFEHSEVIDVPENHVMDIVIIDENGNLHVVEIKSSTENDILHRKYAMSVGLLTKRIFVNTRQTDRAVDVTVQCHIYTLQKGIHWCSLVLKNSVKDTSLVLENLAAALLTKTTTIKDRIGGDIGIHLTAKQIEVVMKAQFSDVSFIEGPPGTGKTYIAYHLCAQVNAREVVYICSNAAYKEYLVYQGMCTPELIPNETRFIAYIQDSYLENYKRIIVDDVHQLVCSEKTWTEFFEATERHSCQVYIFADNKYQSFMTNTAESLERYVQKRFGDNHIYHLSEVHRNSKKVTAYLATCIKDDSTPENPHQLPCSSLVEGQDIEVQSLKNIFEDIPGNELLQLVVDMVEPGRNTGHHEYDVQDIAILVDTTDSRGSTKQLIVIFKHHAAFPVHSAGRFPVVGLTIDELRNFMGFDRPVCICVINKGLGNKRRSIENPKYRAFIASRGVSRVVFVTNSDIDTNMATTMKMDQFNPEPRRLWTAEAGAWIRSVCWIQDTILYVAVTGPWTDRRTEVRLVTVAGDTQRLSMDVSGITPEHVGSSADGGTVVVTDRDDNSWTWYSRESPRVYARQQTRRLEGRPEGVCCTDGGVVILVDTPRDYSLQRYELGDGRLVWQQSVPYSRCLTVDRAGRLYVYDKTSIRVYDPHGHPLSSFPTRRDLGTIYALCADTSGRRVFAGDVDGSVSLYSGGELSAPSVITRQGAGVVRGLAVYSDMYLAVGTYGGLSLYNVEGLLL